jgi:hypothetical protein
MDAMSIWRDIKNMLEEKPVIGYAIAGAIVLVAMFILVSRNMTDNSEDIFIVDQQWFYNEDTSTLQAVSVDDIPPVGSSVAANVVGCGSCKETFISYLYKYTPEARKAKVASLADELTSDQRYELLKVVVAGRLIRAEKGDKDSWVKAGSEESIKILSMGQDKCLDLKKSIINCRPGKARK